MYRNQVLNWLVYKVFQRVKEFHAWYSDKKIMKWKKNLDVLNVLNVLDHGHT